MPDDVDLKFWQEPYVNRMVIEEPMIEVKRRKHGDGVRRAGKRPSLPTWLVVGAIITMGDGSRCQVVYINEASGNWYCTPIGGAP